MRSAKILAYFVVVVMLGCFGYMAWASMQDAKASSGGIFRSARSDSLERAMDEADGR